MDLAIRDVKESDLDAVLELNEAVVPAVNSLTSDKMLWFAKQATYFRVAIGDGALASFLIGLRPGIAYESLNYRWFCENYDNFGYIDRIAVAAHARRRGLASVMYNDFLDYLASTVSALACEVNLRPPNRVSIKFHEQFGFRQVGSQLIDGGDKEVALMIKSLC